MSKMKRVITKSSEFIVLLMAEKAMCNIAFLKIMPLVFSWTILDTWCRGVWYFSIFQID